MQLLPEQSKPDHYNVYQHEDGEVYVVLDGLDPNNLHEPTALEQFLVANYASIAFGYWCLLILTLAFLAGNFIVKPLYQKRKR